MKCKYPITPFRLPSPSSSPPPPRPHSPSPSTKRGGGKKLHTAALWNVFRVHCLQFLGSVIRCNDSFFVGSDGSKISVRGIDHYGIQNLCVQIVGNFSREVGRQFKRCFHFFASSLKCPLFLRLVSRSVRLLRCKVQREVTRKQSISDVSPGKPDQLVAIR